MKMEEFFGLLLAYKRDMRSKGSNHENKRVDLDRVLQTSYQNSQNVPNKEYFYS